ncbi:protein scaf8 [Anaeramoeba flamelloides]|uniref:Protein scaf8 n=1 Tax=Anaeramoeba flamelloides TaxID=1746091 RepID=A0AAV7Y9A4_9EUKA|nr:protein scaf8 [Anaeramoeba flamelloides]
MEFDLFKWTGSIWILEQLEKIDPEQPSSRLINGIAKYAIKNEEFYKYVVKTIELFLNKTEIEKYLVVLYVIDSIVQHSRSRSNYKDRYSKYFGINLEQTINIIFQNKTKFRQIVKVLTLWKKKNIFSNKIIDKILLIAINKGARKYFEILGFDEKTIKTKYFLEEDTTNNNEKESNQTQNIDTASNEGKVITNSESIKNPNSKLIKNQNQFKSDPFYFDYGEDADQNVNKKNQQLFQKMDSNLSSTNDFSTTKTIRPISTLTTSNAITPMPVLTTIKTITDIDVVTDIAISPPPSDHINDIQVNINLNKQNELIKNPLNKSNNNNENQSVPNNLKILNNMINKENNNNDQNLNESFIPNSNSKINIYNNYNSLNQNTNNILNENNKNNILEGKYQLEGGVIPKKIEIQNEFSNDLNKKKNHHSKLIDERSNSLPSNKVTPLLNNIVSGLNEKSSTPILTTLSPFSTTTSSSSSSTVQLSSLSTPISYYGNNIDPKIVNNQQLQQNIGTNFNKESKHNQNNNNFNSYPILSQDKNEKQKKVDYLSNRTTLYLGNLDQSMSENTLYSIFGEFGKIMNCRYLSHKNIAFLTFETHEQAYNALNQMQSQIIYNKPIKIEWSRNSNRNSNNRMNLPTSQPYNSKINQTNDYNNKNNFTNQEQKEKGNFSTQRQQMQIQTQPQLERQNQQQQIQQLARPRQYQQNEKLINQDNYLPPNNNEIPISSNNGYKENEFDRPTKQYRNTKDYRVNNQNNNDIQYSEKDFYRNDRYYNSNHNKQQDYKNENFNNNDQYYKNDFNNNYHQSEHNNNNKQYYKNENFHNNSQGYKNESFHNHDQDYKKESFHQRDQYYKKDFNNNHHYEKNHRINNDQYRQNNSRNNYNSNRSSRNNNYDNNRFNNQDNSQQNYPRSYSSNNYHNETNDYNSFKKRSNYQRKNYSNYNYNQTDENNFYPEKRRRTNNRFKN